MRAAKVPAVLHITDSAGVERLKTSGWQEPKQRTPFSPAFGAPTGISLRRRLPLFSRREASDVVSLAKNVREAAPLQIMLISGSLTMSQTGCHSAPERPFQHLVILIFL